MTIKLRKATEESTFVVTVAFFDTDRSPVAPKLAQWTLKNEDGAIVNNRENVNIDSPGTTVSLVLTGYDLSLPDTTKPLRYLLIEAVYDSVLYGNDLYLREECRFEISNLVSKDGNSSEPEPPGESSAALEISVAVANHAALTTTHGITAFGATLVDDANAATARATLGLGTAATTASTDYATAAHNHIGVYDSAGTAASAVSSHAGGSSVHAIASVTGLQTALDGKSATSHDHAATYAPIAKGVTNGDSHDHAGGDGAQIAYSGLSGLPTLGTAAAQASTAFEAAGAVSTHAALTTTHGISSFGASLVDDADASTARTTLGLGGSAVLAVGTTAGTVAAGDDTRFATGTTGDAFASSHPGGNSHIDWTADQGATNLHSGNIPDLSGTYATVAQVITLAQLHAVALSF